MVLNNPVHKRNWTTMSIPLPLSEAINFMIYRNRMNKTGETDKTRIVGQAINSLLQIQMSQAFTSAEKKDYERIIIGLEEYINKERNNG